MTEIQEIILLFCIGMVICWLLGFYFGRLSK
mgnify:CR=1 FL=1